MNGAFRARMLVLLLAALALIATGCGGDDGDDGGDTAAPTESTEAPAEPAEPAAPTKKEYIAEADAICKKANAGTEKLVEALNSGLDELATPLTPEAIRPLATTVSNQLEELADSRDAVTGDLEKLEAPVEGPPTEYLKARKSFVKALRDQAKAYGALADEVTQEVADAAGTSNVKAQQLADEATKIAKRYGFKVCSQPPK